MLTSTGGSVMLPYWLHICISNAGVNHRSVYSAPQPEVSCNEIPTAPDPREMCGICLSFKKTIVFLPCKHIYSCEKCSVSLTKCPLCRTEIIEKIKIYY